LTQYREVAIGELFEAQNGKAKFIRDYMDAHPGDKPVYSASLVRPFGHVDSFDYDGPFLTWIMNGYGGRVQEVRGRFSVTRDRGVFVPLEDVPTPDLTYMRFAMEPQLVAAAVGRRVDGRLNEYTKIYPGTAEEVLVSLPVSPEGDYDYARMEEIGAKLRRVEAAQAAVQAAQDPLARANFVLDIPQPAKTISLGDADVFSLSIGERVLTRQHMESGVPVYSANALLPFGFIAKSNLRDFDKPSLLWGIDGNFEWNLIPPGDEFATTDHCGRLQILDDRIEPEYVFAYLKATRDRYGFDRVFRASLRNMKADVTVVVPLDANGEPSRERQAKLAAEWEARERAQASSLAALEDVLNARMGVEM
jgi:hypothetical protein